jgi:predicted amidohydrolase YtcJ
MINPKTGMKDYYGIPPGRTQEELDKLVYNIHEAGFQVACHSNGDREIDMVLDAIEKALRNLPREDHRHRIEHCSVVNPKILSRIKTLGVVLALHSYVYEHGDKMEDYGPKRWPMMHPNHSATEMGIIVAGNSDSPVSAAEPLLRIQSMVTRKTAEGKEYGPEQKVTVETAIRIWTMGSAYASFEEDIKGSIEVGKLADFVVLSQDPTEVSPDRIKDITVEKTYVGGKLAYTRK